MELKRSNAVFNTSYPVARLVFDFFNNIEYSGYENIPKKGPALLLAKHQHELDIILEGMMLYRYLGRQGNWVMKDSLPKILELWGGIKIRRPKDVRVKDREERRKLLEEAKAYNQAATEYMEWLYTQGEILVAHPEGTRRMGAMGSIRQEIIDFTMGVEGKHAISIPIIPIGLEYVYSKEHRPQIYVRAGTPLATQTPDLVKKVYDEMKRLSNIR